MREAVGPDTRIVCDGNGNGNERMDLPTAIHLGHRLAELDIFWFEEPISSDDVEGHRRLRASLPMAIAGGEHLTSVGEFLRFIDAEALDVIQPNATRVRGVTEMVRRGEVAAAHGLMLAPHFWNERHVHVAAAALASTYVEYFPHLHHYIEQPLETRRGEVVVPDRPGHGIVFTQETWERFSL